MKNKVTYEIELTELFFVHIEQYKKAGKKKILVKIDKLIDELREHPEIGTGKPEPLKHNLSGLWSRRIDKKNRLIYSVGKDTIIVTVVSAKGHYNDK